jgi:hypothetical protein
MTSCVGTKRSWQGRDTLHALHYQKTLLLLGTQVHKNKVDCMPYSRALHSLIVLLQVMNPFMHNVCVYIYIYTQNTHLRKKEIRAEGYRQVIHVRDDVCAAGRLWYQNTNPPVVFPTLTSCLFACSRETYQNERRALEMSRGEKDTYRTRLAFLREVRKPVVTVFVCAFTYFPNRVYDT